MPIAAILPYLPQLLSAGASLFNFIKDLRSAAKQSGEWTDEHEAQFQKQLDAANDLPESKTDSER